VGSQAGGGGDGALGWSICLARWPGAAIASQRNVCGSSGPNEARPWPEPRTQAVYQSWWALLEWARWAAEVIQLSFMWPPWSFPVFLPAAAFYSVYTSLLLYFSVACVSDCCMIVNLSLFLLLCTCGSLCQIVALQFVFPVSLSLCLSIFVSVSSAIASTS